MSDINQFDIAFVVDVTASMSTFINTARTLMVDMAKTLAKNADIDMQIGIVAYRDHPPQDSVLVTINQLTSPDQAQKHIAALRVAGGGDGPEAVLDGVSAGCERIKWRKHSRRLMVLVGDAPPHGVGGLGDGFPKGCPCGQTIESVTALAEEANITLYAVILSAHDPLMQKSFSQLAQLTGGEAFGSAGHNAIGKIQAILNDEFSNLGLDRRVLDAWNEEATTDKIAEELKEKPLAVANSYMRLRRRGLIVESIPVPA